MNIPEVDGQTWFGGWSQHTLASQRYLGFAVNCGDLMHGPCPPRAENAADGSHTKLFTQESLNTRAEIAPLFTLTIKLPPNRALFRNVFTELLLENFSPTGSANIL